MLIDHHKTTFRKLINLDAAKCVESSSLLLRVYCVCLFIYGCVCERERKQREGVIYQIQAYW